MYLEINFGDSKYTMGEEYNKFLYVRFSGDKWSLSQLLEEN